MRGLGIVHPRNGSRCRAASAGVRMIFFEFSTTPGLVRVFIAM
jgi:hypothetical protein